MKRIIFFLLLILTLPCIAAAQDSVAHHAVRYFFQINNGLLVGKGSNAVSTSINTIHGVTIGDKFRLGAGIGLDNYSTWQTLPLFGSVSYDLFRLDNVAPFVQVNYGWAHGWRNKNDTGVSTSDQGGQMFMAVTGVRVSLGKANLYISGGYKFQSVVSNYGYSTVNPTADALTYPGDGYSNRNFRTFERFVITFGLGLR